MAAGDQLTVGREHEAQPRTVDLPNALRSALEADAGTAAFEKLSYTHQRKFIQWVTGATGGDSGAAT